MRPGRIRPISRPKGGCRRGSGQDMAYIRAEGYLPEGVRAGKGQNPGGRVAARGGSGRIWPLYGPKGGCQRGSGLDRARIRADGYLLVYCHRASAAAGSSQSSRRAVLTAAPGYARRWCTSRTRKKQIQRWVSPRREQPRRVLRGCDSPSVIPYQIFFYFSSQKCDEEPAEQQSKLKIRGPFETTDFHKKSISIDCLSHSCRGGVGGCIFSQLVMMSERRREGEKERRRVGDSPPRNTQRGGSLRVQRKNHRS